MSAVAAEPPVDVTALARRLRYPAVIVGVGLVAVTLLAIIGSEPARARLDPRSTAPAGGHALSVLLTDRGIAVRVVSSLDDIGSGVATTVVLSDPDAVSGRALRAVATSSATVIAIDPSTTALANLDITASLDAQTPAATISPGCPLPAAVTAGSVRVSGDLYAVPGRAVRCYRSQGDAALFAVRRPNGASTVVLGSPSTLSNAELGHEGDAALGLGLLSRGAVAWVPGGLDLAAPVGSHRGLLHLLPERLLWATAQLAVALIVLALWRSRRLGRPVVEPLPVVVRAAETVEGRGRLMQAARARDAAAAALRTASIRRLRHRLRLAADADPAAVTAIVATTTNMAADDVHRVLYGGVPSTDAELVRLAEQLARLESGLDQDRRYEMTEAGLR